MYRLLSGLLIVSLIVFSCKEGQNRESGKQEITIPEFQYFQSFDNTQIAFIDEGDGTSVMLLHGFINDATNWSRSALKGQLLANGYRVIIPDLRGNGRSDHLHTDEGYQDFAQTRDLIALADHLEINNYIVVGYSRGSIILGKLLTMDNRITKAVIGGMGISFTDPNWDVPMRFAKAFVGEEPLSDMTEGAVNYAKSINADLLALSLQQRYQPSTSLTDLNNLDIPLLILAGDEDDSNGISQELGNAMPKAKFKLVPGDHNNTYKSEAFGEAVLEFMEME